jgi:tripartite-type tricarboxylate transporter receptor subunit TctC
MDPDGDRCWYCTRIGVYKMFIANRFIKLVLLLCCSLASSNPVIAQQFSGRVVTMIVNYSPGGPTDIEARMVAKFLPKYLKGVKAVVVKNVPGAGGNIGVNQLAEGRGDEKYNIGFYTWDPVNQLIQNKTLHVKYNDLKFIAGFRQVSLIYVRKDVKPGMKKPADIVLADNIMVGVLSLTNHTTLRQRLAMDLLGAKYEIIPGYKGIRDIDMAIQQGDIQMTNNSLPGWYATSKPFLLDTGVVIPVFQYDFERHDGTTGRNPTLPDVPTFTEVYKDVKGKNAVPSGIKWDALKLLTRIMDSMYRTVFMPPNAPPEAAEEMRKAFLELRNDPEFIAAYELSVKTKPDMIVGAQGELILNDLDQINPKLLEFIKDYIDPKI